MLQFSLRNLLIAVAFVAVGTAALLNANGWWSSLLWGAAFSLLVFAGLAAIYRREAKRAFWSGYVFTGSMYLLLLMYSIQNISSSNASILCYQSLSHYNLVTTKLIVWAYSWLPASKGTQYLPSPPAPAGGIGGGPMMGDDASGMSGSGMMPPGGSGMMPPGSGMPGMPGGMPGMAGGPPGIVGPGGGMMGVPGMPGGMGMGLPPVPNPNYVDQTVFTEVGHALWTLFFSWLGGTVAVWLYRTREKSCPSAAPPRA